MDHALKPVVESINRSMSSHVMLNANKMSSEREINAILVLKDVKLVILRVNARHVLQTRIVIFSVMRLE